uniref:Uncharacterized protein n=1 Tax=Tanacetum cinerariifolium TaxID=118510 RepID=A0A699IJC8_TANCI|nr:hypothetical protein [Tanacetum cinerariifolium]
MNYMTMDIFTKGALWDYWKLGSGNIEPTNEKTLNLEDTNQDDEQEIGENFRIETNFFNYQTPLCEKIIEINYLLKIDLNVLTSDIVRFKTYDEYKDDWIYEWNKNMPYVGKVGTTLKLPMDRNEWEYKNEYKDDERYELCGNETHELPVCIIRRFEMIKYSFGRDKEYIAVKEDEYEDLMIDKYLGSSIRDAFRNELQANIVTLKKELSELNYKEVIEESVKGHVVKEVKNFLPQFPPKAVSDFATPIIKESVKSHVVNKDVIEESVKAHVVNEVKNFLPQFLLKVVSEFSKPMLQDAIAKSPISLAQSSSSHQSATKSAKSLSELESKHILYDNMLKSGSSCSHQTHKELLNALTWSIKLDESRSTHKSSRGKPPSKPSKSRKSRSVNDAIEETFFEIGSNDVHQTFDKKPNDFAQPSHDSSTEQPSFHVNSKRQKNDWYKKSPKKINDAVPPLTFDELMSTPIVFSAFAMNRLGLTMLIREVLVGHVFNLLKEYDRPYIGKPLPLIEKEGRLTIHVEVFINNDLEYLKEDKAKRTHCSSITKMPTPSQTSNTLHNAIMEAGGKDRLPMLAPNPPYKYTWADKTVPVTEGSSETTNERYMENYKNVLQDIRDQLNAEAEAV